MHPHMCVPAIRDSKHSLTRPFYDPTCEAGCCALKGLLARAFADSSKDSPDEVLRPPRCRCSKNHKPQKNNLYISLVPFRRQMPGTPRRLSSPRMRLKPWAARTGRPALPMDKRSLLILFSTRGILTFCTRSPSRVPTSPRTTRTRPSATGRSRCLPTRRCTSGARPLTSSRATSSR